MNSFKFIGTIRKPKAKEDIIKNVVSQRKQLKLHIFQNETNSAFVTMYSNDLVNGRIPVYLKEEKNRRVVDFDNRFDKERLNQISYISKFLIIVDGQVNEFIWKEDFMELAYEMITTLPENTIYEVSGEYSVNYINGKQYNNFSIKRIKVDNSLRPEFTLKLNLFYNYKSLDESDKANKFLINSFIEQYNYKTREVEYFPLQTQFITNRFDFKKQTDIDIIKHRKLNLKPSEKEGYVKAVWEAQYVRGAQLLVVPPLNTFPKDIQFEVLNAGRDLREYTGRIVGEAGEYICLTRPDNTLNKDGKVYISLNCTDKEFESKITKEKINKNKSFDEMAEKEAIKNPFN